MNQVLTWGNYNARRFYQQFCSTSARWTTCFIDKSYYVFVTSFSLSYFHLEFVLCFVSVSLLRQSKIFWQFYTINMVTNSVSVHHLFCVLLSLCLLGCWLLVLQRRSVIFIIASALSQGSLYSQQPHLVIYCTKHRNV